MTTEELLKKVIEQEKQAMEESMIMVEADAKLNCPVKTGTLKKSITHDVITDGDTITGEVGSNVEYAPFVEVKTTPYLENSIDKNKAAIEEKFKKVIGN